MPHYFKFSENSHYTLETITRFNNLCYPVRGNHEQYDHYRFVENPFAKTEKDFLYGVEKDGKYVAQMLTTPAPLALNEQEIPAYWGQDYFVLEDYRGLGIGKELSSFYLKNDYYIAVGFSPKSAVIHQKMGAKEIGYLDFYEKWASPFHKIKWIFQRVLKISSKKTTDYAFPKEVLSFKRIENVEDLHFPLLNWNKNTVETLRNKVYFQWRFLFLANRYFIYQSEKRTSENAVYFVCKPYFYRGVNWLRVIDYRFNINQIQDFQEILQAAEKLRKELNLYGILISSSLKATQEILEKKHFLQTKHEIVLTTFPFNSDQTDKSNQFMISFADSDMDMHSNLGKFNFEKNNKN